MHLAGLASICRASFDSRRRFGDCNCYQSCFDAYISRCTTNFGSPGNYMYSTVHTSILCVVYRSVRQFRCSFSYFYCTPRVLKGVASPSGLDGTFNNLWFVHAEPARPFWSSNMHRCYPHVETYLILQR